MGGALSYIVTVFGLPMAILVFIMSSDASGRAKVEELYQRLSDEYTGFLKLVLSNPDLQFCGKRRSTNP